MINAAQIDLCLFSPKTLENYQVHQYEEDMNVSLDDTQPTINPKSVIGRQGDKTQW